MYSLQLLYLSDFCISYNELCSRLTLYNSIRNTWTWTWTGPKSSASYDMYIHDFSRLEYNKI